MSLSATITPPSPNPDSRGPLDLLPTLLLNAEDRTEWLRQRESPRVSELYLSAFILMGGLLPESGWEIPKVLDELECNKRSREELDALGEAELSACCAFLGWLTDLLSYAPDQISKRALIGATRALYTDANYDLPICERAMRDHDCGGGFKPIHLLELGENGTAFQFARRSLDTLVGARARQLDEANPFSGLPNVHIRTATLDALARYPPGVPGAKISFERAGRLTKHIEIDCGACRSAAEGRRIALGLPAVIPPISFQPLASVDIAKL
jgi:hypothetical protein